MIEASTTLIGSGFSMRWTSTAPLGVAFLYPYHTIFPIKDRDLAGEKIILRYHDIGTVVRIASITGC